MTNALPTPALPAFRRTVCMACGYSLAGLAASGRCPECGEPYRSDEIVLYGWGRGRLASAANSRGWSLGWRLVPPTLLIGVYLWPYSLGFMPRGMAAWALIAVVPWVLVVARGLVRLVRPRSATTTDVRGRCKSA